MDNNTYSTKEAVIAIAGVGGGGGNAINYMIESGVEGVKFIAFNTDFQDLYKKSKADVKVRLGEDGLGAGANPLIGKELAEQTKKEIEKTLEGCDMLFITAGMGGGTGTGASPVIAKIAKELGILTIGIVTKPFEFEGAKKMKLALNGIEELKQHVDSLIVIPNEKLFKISEDNDISVSDSYKMVNRVLQMGVSSIIGLIKDDADVNLDFNDVKTTLENTGVAAFGFGVTSGDQDPVEAVEEAINNPLLEQSMLGAKNVLVYFTFGQNFPMSKFKTISKLIREKLKLTDDNNLIHGYTLVPEDTFKISIIAANFDNNVMEENEEFKGTEFDSEKNKGLYGLILPKYDE